jgi:hypothetical protein
MDDALLVLQAGLTPAERQACLDRVRAQVALTATMGPRLCEVRGPSATWVGLPALRGVLCVIGREAADAERAALAIPGLDEGERLFLAGWLARGRKTGPRPGAGQDWDAPGFTPPDAP